MARGKRQQDEAFGGDSFLDVVANMVGILIILVIVVGLRVKHLPSEVSDELRQAAAAAEQAEATAAALKLDVHELAAQMQQVAATSAGRMQERDVLAQMVAHHRHALDQQRGKLADAERSQFDLDRAIAAERAALDDLTQRIAQLETDAAPRIELMAYPTPISQTVYGKEVHFQLRRGRVAWIPLDELIERFKRQAQQKVHRLRDAATFGDSVGPIDGFRLRYVVERVDVALDRGSAGSFAQLRSFTLVPTSDELGESLDVALRPESEFRIQIAGLDPQRTTVTLWAYSDSFPMFRALRKELHELGFGVAGRPLDESQPISGSPHGSKSAAQ